MLEELKEKLIGISIAAEAEGLCKHKSGNFSIRDEKTGYIVITPSGIDRKTLKVDDVSVIDFQFNLIEGLKPSSESLMHIRIYQTCPEVYAIVHTHSKMATVFSVLNKSIPAIVYEVAGLRLSDGEIPVAQFGIPGTDDLARKVACIARKSDLILMEKHGVVTLGKDIDQAFLSAQYVEELADIYYHVLRVNEGKEPDRLTDEQLNSWKYPTLDR